MARNPTVLSRTALAAQHQGLPKSRHGHPFAPDRVPPGFHTVVDPDKNPPQPWRDLPPATGLPPYRINLDSILDPETLKGIQASGKLVFHAVGDTGGVNTPTYIEGVARFMSCDIDYGTPPTRPSFFYHLGDVVYYDGESANYWPEFYEPYLNYHAPIVAIPGNHDGDVNPTTGEASLAAFVRNFCAQSAILSPDNRDSPRRTMTQPNVFWTLNTPLVTIIGMYSNCPEGGQVSDIQRNWFISELKDADPNLPIILAIHHPIYSAYGSHPGSTRLKDLLESSCASAKRAPDVVLTGHVHDYQRFSAPLYDKKNVPFIVAGAGGYNKRLHVLGKVFHQAQTDKALPIQIGQEPELLESFNDSQHGYLRVTVTKQEITLDYVAVPDPSENAKDAILKPYDSVEVQLAPARPAPTRKVVRRAQ
jgi:acid phosphatase type 7